ncbi:MAG: hypothetical protein K0S44_1982 [Bacteroidetes bacterium]|jgi:hypothetical protein|nr:hypothetical protein [Bacteroidota bacterium]
MKFQKTIVLITTIAVISNVQAEKIRHSDLAPLSGSSKQRSMMSGCAPATAQTDLDINNVRATILNGGDMWWDLMHGQYEIPKGSGVTSLYAGSLWIGGLDAGDNLKIAAMTYRQGGNDFWPGPLDAFGSVPSSTCTQWDKHFTITREEVETFRSTGIPTPNITNWPAFNSSGQPMAPFFDTDGNGDYNPMAGDYPDYDLNGNRGCEAQLKGDKTLWWVFNDMGNSHSETGGNSIGLEIQAQAFGFKTNDEINNMTFYKYKIINKSSFDLKKTYFGVWADPDLGGGGDDYVGCDVTRGLGYCYNGDLVDDGVLGGENTYGSNPPAIGIDFFEGPKADDNGLADPQDSSANGIGYNDIIIDNERLGMSKFVYYTNGAPSGQGDPHTAFEFYNYLTGYWRDATPFTYGGTGHLSGGPVCDYMFPGDSDPNGYGTDGNIMPSWDESSVNNHPADRRFLQSSGPFTLKSGSVNYITTGVVWARATQGGNLASLALLKAADTKAQALFQSCFKILDGPTAPDLTIQELNNQLIFSLSQSANSNNIGENYSERDPYVLSGPDTLYKFEGYQVFQLKDPTVNVNDLHNIDKARLVMQCDIQNSTGQIINYTNDPAISSWVPVEEVNGSNKGIIHSFNLSVDKFASGVNNLVNHKQYYYMVIAYAFNSGEIAANPFVSNTANKPYLSGRRNVKVYTAIPHIPNPEAMGTIQNSDYGSGPEITRIEGQGNGGRLVDLTYQSENEIVFSNDGRSVHPVYQSGKGPIEVKVIDPLNVPAADFTLKFTSVQTTSMWSLKNNVTGETVNSDRSIAIRNEQLFPQWGISVSITQVKPAGSADLETGGFMEATMSFSDPSKRWLTSLPDEDGDLPSNWIRSGSYKSATGPAAFDDRYKVVGTNVEFIDPQAKFEKILNGSWAPYALCAYSDAAKLSTCGPALTNGGGVNILHDSLTYLSSVDIVITNDRSKWTRCPVLEMQEEPGLAEGGAPKLALRRHASVNKAGDPVSGADNNDFPTGMSWFPGYALNLETGERLNMAFGEDSWLESSNGKNMKWDPTSVVYSSTGLPVYGGKHYIYVFGHNGDIRWPAGDLLLPGELKDVPRYDGGAAIYKMLRASEQGVGASYNLKKNAVFSHAMWVNIPLLANGHSAMESEVRVKIRMSKPYLTSYSARWGSTVSSPSNDTAMVQQNHNFPMYSFNTSGLQTILKNDAAAKDALQLINIVPNPYYAYSEYEKTTLENVVKITNLPVKCEVSIYSLNGNLVRRIEKDNDITSVDWDLKNDVRIPVSSGMYIIHVKANGIGEKTLKWFGVLRPVDLDGY